LLSSERITPLDCSDSWRNIAISLKLGALAQAFARGGRHLIVGAPLFAHFAKGEYQTAEGEDV